MAKGLVYVDNSRGIEKVIFTRSLDALTKHLKPFYMTTHMNGYPMSHVMVDNGATVNIISMTTLEKLHKTKKDFLPTKITVSGFARAVTNTKGILGINLQIGTSKVMVAFFVIEPNTNYTALLGRDWIHSNRFVLSSMHQSIVLWGGPQAEIIQAEKHPFTMDINISEAKFYNGQFGPLRLIGQDKNGRLVGVTAAVELPSQDLDALVSANPTR